jgi:hypothetical protein
VRRVNRGLRSALSWLCLLIGPGCSSLPDFAAPKSSPIESGASDPQDAISYRPLQRSDFRRNRPPGQTQHGKYELGALTCGSLQTSPDTQMQLETVTERNGDTHYRGRFKILRFRALMDRQCSWWNPKNREPAYTLQHEQIHFALYEIEARRMNERAAKLVRDTLIEGDDREQIVARLNATIKELLDDHVEQSLERNRDFDEDTSLGHDPERQAEWWKRIQRELAETAAFK